MTAHRPAWIFDGSEIDDPLGYGQRAVDFLKALRHPKSRKPERAFDLPIFWERIVRRIYGPVDDNANRIIKTVFILIPRGGRKTTIGAGLSLMHTFGHERTEGGLVLTAASAEKQALLSYDEATAIVRATPWLARSAKVTESQNLIEHKKSRSSLEAIAADGDVQLGTTPAFVLADELIAWKNRTLWRALRTGLVKTAGTLLIVITQAGRGQQNLAWEMFDYAKKVDRGEIDDPGFLPVIFETPAKADWRDERIWRAVNPGLDLGFPDIAGLRQLAREAAERPADRDDFRQFNLNVWLDYSVSSFVEMEVYDEGAAPVDLGNLKEKPCWIGVDLGLVHDLAAIVAAWPDDDEGVDIVAWFFCPKDNLQRKADKDRVPYPLWAERGLLTPTPGNVTDYRIIEGHIRELCATLNVQEIAFDPAYAQAVAGPLSEDGLPVVTMRQGWLTMGPAIKELERIIVSRRFRHGGNPVLRWNFENVVLKTDEAGNRSFHKGKSRDRIDGAVATAMAVSRARAGATSRSVFDGPVSPDDFLVAL